MAQSQKFVAGGAVLLVALFAVACGSQPDQVTTPDQTSQAPAQQAAPTDQAAAAPADQAAAAPADQAAAAPAAEGAAAPAEGTVPAEQAPAQGEQPHN